MENLNGTKASLLDLLRSIRNFHSERQEKKNEQKSQKNEKSKKKRRKVENGRESKGWENKQKQKIRKGKNENDKKGLIENKWKIKAFVFSLCVALVNSMTDEKKIVKTIRQKTPKNFI